MVQTHGQYKELLNSEAEPDIVVLWVEVLLDTRNR